MDYKFLLEESLKYQGRSSMVVDENANIIYYNDLEKNILGINDENIIGRNILDVFKNPREEDSYFCQVLKTGQPIIDGIQTFENFRGNIITVINTIIPLKKDGKIIGAMEMLGDVNDYKEISKRIIQFQEKQHPDEIRNLEHKSNGTIYTIENIIGESDFIKELKNKVRKIANSSSPVLVYGETGTGKELIVQAIHNESIKRRDKPFVAQNCAAIPKNLLESILFGTTEGSFTGAKEKPGLFELAQDGTILLDEINSMDLELQAKLLRVLQEGTIRRVGGRDIKKVNVRVMASMNIRPLVALKKGIIREDLFYRLNVISLEILPLRKRKEDIKVLAKHFFNLYKKFVNKEIVCITDECIDCLEKYNWPGNVRELKHMIENLMNFLDNKEIRKSDLPKHIRLSRVEDKIVEYIEENEEKTIPNLKETLGKVEKDLIIKALSLTDGNCAEAARLLGVPRQTLYNKCKKFEI